MCAPPVRTYVDLSCTVPTTVPRTRSVQQHRAAQRAPVRRGKTRKTLTTEPTKLEGNQSCHCTMLFRRNFLTLISYYIIIT